MFRNSKDVRMHIREYRPEDQERIKQCIIELQDFERSLEPDCVEGITIVTRYFHDLLDACREKNGRIFVAEVNGEVVGFVSVRIETDWDTYLSSITEHGYISDIVLLPAYRSQGIGRALLQKAEEYARAQGIELLK